MKKPITVALWVLGSLIASMTLIFLYRYSAEIFLFWKGIGSEANAAVIGSVVGGVLSTFVAVFSFYLGHKAELNRDASERKRRDETNAFRFYTGYQRLMSRNYSLRRHIDEAFSRQGDSENMPAEPWQFVQVSLSAPLPTSFYSVDDLAFLFEAKEFDLLSRLELLQVRTFTNLAAMEKYNQKREFLSDLLTPSKLDGDIAVSEIPQKMKPWLDRESATLNQLIAQIIEGYDEDIELMEKMLDPLGDAIKKCFQDPEFPVLKRV